MSDNRFRQAARRVLLARGSWAETSRVASVLRKETVGGALLLAAAAVAMLWANSPWSSSYHTLSGWRFGVEAIGLNLTLSSWAAEGLLAIFFFVVGVELKREFVAGDLRDPNRAALPIAAAVGGMVAPAVIFLVIAAHAGPGVARGWAIPTATDIAFAVAVLALISTHLPSALRTFLLTLAVVDDLLAITVIAVFYSERIHLGPLALALIPLLAFAVCVQRGARSWWLLLPLAVVTWALVHESGVHATVAGVVLGFTVPVSAADTFERRIHPISAAVAVPVFAFFAAGVTVGGYDGLTSALTNPITLGVVAGLVVGKTIGVFGTARILAAVTRASLDSALRWTDVFGLSVLAGIGFTVSLLIGDLAYGSGTGRAAEVKVGVLAGSLLAAALAAVILRLRNRHYRAICEEESLDLDDDGVPDVFER